MSTTDLFLSLMIQGKKLAELLPNNKNKPKTIENIAEKVLGVVMDLVQVLEEHRAEFSAEEWFPNVVRKIERSLYRFIECDVRNESIYRNLATEVGKFIERPLSDNTNENNTNNNNISTNNDNYNDDFHWGSDYQIFDTLGKLSNEHKYLLEILSCTTREVEMKKKDLLIHSFMSEARPDIIVKAVFSPPIPPEYESIEHNFEKCLKKLVKEKLIDVAGVTASSDKVRNKNVGLKYKIPNVVRNAILRDNIIPRKNVLHFYADTAKSMFLIRGTSVFNMDVVRLNAKTLNWLHNRVFYVLDLGNWNDDPKKYVVVEDMDALKNILRSVSLVFLRLKGISGIVELPNEVYKNKRLAVLDLRGCPNLESLAQGIEALQDLRYFDLSECYLLDHIPQEISRLSELRVLKGFIINPTSTNRLVSKSKQYPSPSSASLSDLSSLKRLWKLTIRTRDMKFPTSSHLSLLCQLECLIHLKITWVGTSSESPSIINDDTSEFPAKLTKFEMEAATESTATQLLKLIARRKDTMGLEKLYIRGGNLCKLVPDIDCKILRLQYLPGLRLNCHEMTRSFPGLHRLEMSLDVIYSLLRQSFEIATSSLDRDICWKPSLTYF